MIDYVHHDGILFFLRTPGSFEPHIFQDTGIFLGRYLAAYYETVIGWFIDSISDYKFIRLWNIFLFSISSALLHRCLQGVLKNKLNSFLITIMIFTLPAFQCLVSYSGNFTFPPAILLATLSILCELNIPLGMRLAKTFANHFRWLSIFFLLCSICFYQSAAMFYWAICLFFLLFPLEKNWDHNLQRQCAFLSTGILSLFIYMLILIFVQKLLPIEFTGKFYHPYALNTNYLGRIIWFLQEPFVNVLNLWSIFPRIEITFVVMCLIISALTKNIISIYNHQKVDRFYRIFTFIILISVLIILSYLPNLMSSGKAGWYRTTAGFATAILFLFIWSTNQWTNLFPLVKRDKILTCFLIIGCIAGSYLANKNIYRYRAMPSFLEFQYIKNKIAERKPGSFQKIHVVQPIHKVEIERYDEFGILTSHYKTDLDGFIIGVFRDLDREDELYRNKIYLTVSKTEDAYSTHESTLFINMNNLKYY